MLLFITDPGTIETLRAALTRWAAKHKGKWENLHKENDYLEMRNALALLDMLPKEERDETI